MNKETIKKYKKEFEAWLEGTEIQFRDKYEIWLNIKPKWDSIYGEYRIKPAEPKEFWINVYESGVMRAHATEENARNRLAGGGKIIHAIQDMEYKPSNK